MLTNAAVKAARPRSRAYKMFDERGLHLFVAPTGLKAWRMKYRFGRREKLLSLGRFPEISLAEARDDADRARELLAGGRDPSIERQAACSAELFETVARAWHADRRDRWSDVHAADVLASLERNVFPAIGSVPIGTIGATAVLELVQAIEARGAHETARRVRQRIDNVFAYAMVRDLVTANPASLIAAELAPAPIGKQRHPALLELELVRELLNAAEEAATDRITKLASRFLALTAVRMSTLRAARLDEFEDLDGDMPIWRIPAHHMKLTKARKADPANAHLVPLSSAAVEILRELLEHHEKNGYDTHSSPLFPIGAGAIGDLYSRAGFAGRHVPHGWRASFSTLMNERNPLDRDVVDQALAHVPSNKVEAAYNRAEHLQRRRDLFRAWAEMLIP